MSVVHSDGTVDQKYVVWSDDQGRIFDCFLAKNQEKWLRLKEREKQDVCKILKLDFCNNVLRL